MPWAGTMTSAIGRGANSLFKPDHAGTGGAVPGYWKPNSRAYQTLKATVVGEYGYLCHLCGGEIEDGEFNLDHLVPRSRGGSDEPWNLRPAHRACNVRRGNRPLPQRTPRPSRKW